MLALIETNVLSFRKLANVSLNLGTILYSTTPSNKFKISPFYLWLFVLVDPMFAKSQEDKQTDDGQVSGWGLE